jgi:two-component system, chemotaxis family, sensor kinase Cph1
MQDLIHDLLEYSLADKQQAPSETVEARGAVDTALSNLSQEITSTQAVVDVAELPVLRYRSTQLVQVFQNLIGNALKFRSEKPPRIHVSAVRREHGWRISVHDNGIGIDPQHYRRIFSMFQRLHGRDRYEGMGIGLSLCKKIVEFHGGEIGVEPNLGGGSHFWFTVPDHQPDVTPHHGMPLLAESVAGSARNELGNRLQ